MQFLKHLLKRKKITFAFISNKQIETDNIKQSFEDLNCELNEIQLMDVSRFATRSNITLVFPGGGNNEIVEAYYNRVIESKNKPAKLLVVSDDIVWKNRHDDKFVFNLPANSHHYEIARNLHYLSLIG